MPLVQICPLRGPQAKCGPRRHPKRIKMYSNKGRIRDFAKWGRFIIANKKKLELLASSPIAMRSIRIIDNILDLVLK